MNKNKYKTTLLKRVWRSIIYSQVWKSFDEESEYYTQVNMVTCRNRSSQLKFFIKSPEMLSNITQMLS